MKLDDIIKTITHEGVEYKVRFMQYNSHYKIFVNDKECGAVTGEGSDDLTILKKQIEMAVHDYVHHIKLSRLHLEHQENVRNDFINWDGKI